MILRRREPLDLTSVGHCLHPASRATFQSDLPVFITLSFAEFSIFFCHLVTSSPTRIPSHYFLRFYTSEQCLILRKCRGPIILTLPRSHTAYILLKRICSSGVSSARCPMVHRPHTSVHLCCTHLACPTSYPRDCFDSLLSIHEQITWSCQSHKGPGH